MGLVKMTTELIGKVLSVKKYVDGSIDVVFLHGKHHTKFQYIVDSNEKNNFPKELIRTLAVSRDENIVISFNNEHIPISVEIMFRENPFIEKT